MNDTFSHSLKESCVRLNDAEICMQAVEFQDKILIHISRDGELDRTYDVTTSADLRSGNGYRANPTALMGGSHNVKCSIMASQVGALVTGLLHKNVIISTSSKLWNEENDERDFEKLCMILEMVKKSHQKNCS